MAAIVGRKDSAVAYVGTTETLKLADKVSNVTNFEFPKPEKTNIDVTDFDSDGAEEEYGTTDFGEVSIEQHLVSKEKNAKFQQLCDAETDVYFNLFLKNKEGEVIVGRKGKGKVKSIEYTNIQINNAFVVKITLKVNGKVTDVEAEPAE